MPQVCRVATTIRPSNAYNDLLFGEYLTIFGPTIWRGGCCYPAGLRARQLLFAWCREKLLANNIGPVDCMPRWKVERVGRRQGLQEGRRRAIFAAAGWPVYKLSIRMPASEYGNIYLQNQDHYQDETPEENCQGTHQTQEDYKTGTGGDRRSGIEARGRSPTPFLWILLQSRSRTYKHAEGKAIIILLSLILANWTIVCFHRSLARITPQPLSFSGASRNTRIRFPTSLKQCALNSVLGRIPQQSIR